MNTTQRRTQSTLLAMTAVLLVGCPGEEPEGLGQAQPAATTVVMDFFHQPDPLIPLPNDLATRYDATSPTGRRLNASVIASSEYESRTRELIDQLDGWGSFQPITVPFSDELDVTNIRERHDDVDYATDDDVMYLIDVDPDSPDFGTLQHLDLGNGNYPAVLEDRNRYGRNDPRGWTMSLIFEEADEDINGNGVLDRGEDTDADGVLDVPNYFPGASPDPDDITARTDALMTFYERETHTLIARPLKPLRERTTYAVVITRRLLDEAGRPVGSPYPFINHNGQTAALQPLASILEDRRDDVGGLTLDQVAFAFTFTTQSTMSHWAAVRDGLYGHGVQSHLGEEYPAQLSEIVRPWAEEKDVANPHILYTEQWSDLLNLVLAQLFGLDPSTRAYQAIVDSWRYVDFQVFGTFESPQLFERYDDEGNLLGYNDQSWPPDLDSVPAQTRSETVHFWMTVPRPEVSLRGEGEPVPVAILAHGYLTNRLELLPYVGFFAKYGFATIAIDDVSHGLDLGEDELELAMLLGESFRLGPLVEELAAGRAIDLDGDGALDPGEDFWTGYGFHNRDNVRQSLLDHVQAIRILRTFDGETRWAFDVDGDGENELAGDFDGDGVVDLGGEVDYAAIGGSLGGLMSVLLGSVEPAVTAVTPVSGGAGLFDVAQRSLNPGVPEAVLMRLMGPIYLGTRDADSGAMLIETFLPDLARKATLAIATVDDVEIGDTMVVVDLDNGERGCGYVSDQGTVRAGIATDRGDRHQIDFYHGDALVLGSGDCAVIRSQTPYRSIDTFEVDVEFQNTEWAADSELVALGDGLGRERATPELRRTLALAQIMGEPADPAVYARYMHDEPFTYPGTGETTGAHSIIVTTLGDMAVPGSTGVALARAAGYIDFLRDDERFGVPPNQVLIDTYVVESVHNLERFTHAETGAGIHLDVENFSEGTDMWGTDIPRLDPPLRYWSDTDLLGQPRGGVAGAIFPLPVPEGQHGFPFPGELTDRHLAACETDCEDLVPFDTGNFLFNSLGRYMRSGAQELNVDACNSRNDCDDFPELPEERRELR